MATIIRGFGGSGLKKHYIIKNGVPQHGYDFTNATWTQDGLYATVSGNASGNLLLNNPIILNSSKFHIMGIEIRQTRGINSYLTIKEESNSQLHPYALSVWGNVNENTWTTYFFKIINKFEGFTMGNSGGTHIIKIKNLYLIEI